MLPVGVCLTLPDLTAWDPSACWPRRESRMVVFPEVLPKLPTGVRKGAPQLPVEARFFLPLAAPGCPVQHQVAGMGLTRIPLGQVQGWCHVSLRGRARPGVGQGFAVESWGVWWVEILSVACAPSSKHPGFGTWRERWTALTFWGLPI